MVAPLRAGRGGGLSQPRRSHAEEIAEQVRRVSTIMPPAIISKNHGQSARVDGNGEAGYLGPVPTSEVVLFMLLRIDQPLTRKNYELIDQSALSRAPAFFASKRHAHLKSLPRGE
jgi:hypothetical protein